MRNKLALVLLFCITITLSLTAQKRSTISGFVTDNSNGEALIGANVFIKELGFGASTNISGYFVIPGVPHGEYTLICSYIGYKTEKREFIVDGECNGCITIELAEDVIKTDEVVVTGDSVETIEKLFIKPISKINLSPVQINQIPRFIEADLLRALQTMPGIVSLSDFSSALYIRGGTPDQNLYLIDGADVYNPEHAFGIFSTFNTNAIKKVELSKGGFAAEYGGRLSSVLDVTNLDGNRKEFEGVANVSLLSASTTLQMPIGSIGSLSGSFRRTYIDQTVAKIVDDIPDYYFYDANIKAFFDLGNRDKLTVSFFNGLDDLNFKFDEDAQESFEFLYDWGNTNGSVNWKHIFNPKLFASFWVTGSRFESNFNLEAVELEEENYLSDYAFKTAVEYYASQEWNFKFGAEQKLLHEKYRQDAPNQIIDIENNRQFTTAYLAANWKPLPVWDIQAGVRFNRFSADTVYTNFAPRFSLKYRLTENSNIKFATGVYYQYLNRLPRLFFASIWSSANKYNNESSSKHFILSYQRAIGSNIEFELEGYYKDYKNLYSFNENVGADITTDINDPATGNPVYKTTENVYNRGDGKSYGVEALFRKDKGALTGWISYSYSVTKYTFDKINNQEEFNPRHNRGNVVNGVFNMDLGNVMNEIYGEPFEVGDSKWTLGLNFVYASGQPMTVPSSAYITNRLPDQGNVGVTGDQNPSYNLYPSSINTFNLPDYIRMDISITYEKDYGSWSLSPYLQIFNLGNRQNVWFIQYEEEVKDGVFEQKVEKVNMLPLLPSLGVTVRF